MRSLAELIAAARAGGPRLVAVAAAADPEVLAAIDAGWKQGLCRAALVGDPATIEAEAQRLGMDLAPHRLVPAGSAEECAAGAAELVARNEAAVLVKGLLPTHLLLRQLLGPEHALRSGRLMSHFALFEVPGLSRLLAVTDAGMNVSPDLEAKAAILRNAVGALRQLGWERPRVAVLTAAESVDPRIPGVVDACVLSQMAQRGAFGPCDVDGPLSLDLSLSAAAAGRKAVGGSVAGQAEVLLAPDLNAGNILYKALVWLAQAKAAAVVIGARVPVVVPSRADSIESRLLSLALGICLCGPAAI